MKPERDEPTNQARPGENNSGEKYIETDREYQQDDLEYENDKSEDTGIPGFGVKGDEDDRSVDDDTTENQG